MRTIRAEWQGPVATCPECGGVCLDKGDHLVRAASGRVRFTATITRSEKDAHFGFAKRPHGFAVISHTEGRIAS